MGSIERVKEYHTESLNEIKQSYKDNIKERGLGKSPLLEKMAKICAPAGLLALLYFIYLNGTKKQMIKIYEVIMCVVFACLFILHQILTGNRNELGLFILVICCASYIFKCHKLKKYFLVLLPLFLIYVYCVFSSVLIKQTNFETQIELIENSFCLKYDDEKNLFTVIPEIYHSIYSAYLWFLAYLTHGFYELNMLMLKPSVPTFYGGNNLMYLLPLLQYLDFLPTDYLETMYDSLDRTGVYLTIFGTFYLDFKWFSLLLFFVLGVLLGRQELKFIKNQKFSSGCITIIGSVAIIFSPIGSILSAGGGLLLFLLLWIFIDIIIKNKICAD